MSDLPPQPPRRRWRWIVAGAVAAALVVATVVTVAVMRPGREATADRYRVTVFLDREVTADQKRAVEAALGQLHPVDGVKLTTREESWARLKEAFKDEPETLASLNPETMPETYDVVVEGGSTFDCATVRPVSALPGVYDLTINRIAVIARLPDKISCP